MNSDINKISVAILLTFIGVFSLPFIWGIFSFKAWLFFVVLLIVLMVLFGRNEDNSVVKS